MNLGIFLVVLVDFCCGCGVVFGVGGCDLGWRRLRGVVVDFRDGSVNWGAKRGVEAWGEAAGAGWVVRGVAAHRVWRSVPRATPPPPYSTETSTKTQSLSRTSIGQ